MRSSKIALGVAAIIAAGLFAVSAPSSAAPAAGFGPLKTLSLEQSVVEKTHGWHRKCRKGLNGSHKHARGAGRIQCTTAKCHVNVFGYKVCEYF